MAEWVNADFIETYQDAVQAVLKAINMRVDPRKVLWCNYPVLSLEHDELLDKVKKDTKKLEKEIGGDLYPSNIWYVGIPKFRLIRRGIAYLSCELDLYYVVCDIGHGDCPWCWCGKILPRVDTFDVPLCLVPPLIDALSKNEMEVEDAHIIERTPGCTVYEFMGREWKIPDAFLGFVWALKEKGKDLSGLLDPVSCSLITKFIKEPPSLELPKLAGGDDYQAITTCLKEQMGYPKAKAEEAAKYVMEKFLNESLESKLTHALNYLSG